MHAVPLLDSSANDNDNNSDTPAPAEVPLRDLRRVTIHPDHWYPLAWSREVKRGKAHGVRFAGEPIVLVQRLFITGWTVIGTNFSRSLIRMLGRGILSCRRLRERHFGS